MGVMCGGQEAGTGQKGFKTEDRREQAWPLGDTTGSFTSGREYSFQSDMLMESPVQRSQGMGNQGHRNQEELEELVCRLRFLLLKYTGPMSNQRKRQKGRNEPGDLNSG